MAGKKKAALAAFSIYDLITCKNQEGTFLALAELPDRISTQ